MTTEDFTTWYGRQHPRLVSTLTVLCGQVDEAVDATDEAFARALDRWDSVSQMASPAGWTYRVALNRLRSQMRRKTLERRLVGRWSTPPPDAILPDPDVWDAVRSLPPRQRTAVVLRYVADFSEDDIAAEMGVSRGTVAATLSAAKKKLAARFEDPNTEEARCG